jgi:hypothetical protein
VDGARPVGAARFAEEIGRRLVEYLLDEQRFWTAVAPPAVSLDEPAFSLKEHFGGLRRYWRGPTWVNSAWLVWRGMVRLGYEQQAAALARTITDTVSREGLREFYDPQTGVAWALRTSLGPRSRSSCSTLTTRASVSRNERDA